MDWPNVARAAAPLLMTLGLTSQVAANAGPARRGGDLVAEPLGLADVEITHETLLVDLRPLAQAEMAQVEVLYRVQNRGAERKLRLLFATGSEKVCDFQVWLDDEPVPSAPMPADKLPAGWQPPEKTPGINGAAGLAYLKQRSTTAAIAFEVTLSPGPHMLKARYRASAVRSRSGSPTVEWQFAYVLAPARAWAGFGGLDVTVHLPTDWHAASEPALTREGDVLRGHYDKLPADALALTVQAPAGPDYDRMRTLGGALLLLALLGGLMISWWIGRRFGARQWSTVAAAILGGFVCGAGMMAAGMFAVEEPIRMLPPGQANRGAFRHVPAFCGAGLFFWLGVIVTAVSASRAQRANRA